MLIYWKKSQHIFFLYITIQVSLPIKNYQSSHTWNNAKADVKHQSINQYQNYLHCRENVFDNTCKINIWTTGTKLVRWVNTMLVFKKKNMLFHWCRWFKNVCEICKQWHAFYLNVEQFLKKKIIVVLLILFLSFKLFFKDLKRITAELVNKFFYWTFSNFKALKKISSNLQNCHFF